MWFAYRKGRQESTKGKEWKWRWKERTGLQRRWARWAFMQIAKSGLYLTRGIGIGFGSGCIGLNCLYYRLHTRYDIITTVLNMTEKMLELNWKPIAFCRYLFIDFLYRELKILHLNLFYLLLCKRQFYCALFVSHCKDIFVLRVSLWWDERSVFSLSY